MLSKLLKYEFKATSRVILPTYGALIILSGITALFGRFVPIELDAAPRLVQIIFPLLIITTVFAFIGCVMGTGIYCVVRYNNLLNNQGYLMMSLPVSSSQHIISKLIPSIVWICLSLALSAVLAPTMVFVMSKIPFSINFDALVIPKGAILMIFTLCFTILMGITGVFLMCYAAASIGASFNKNRVFATIASFVGLDFASRFITLIVMALMGFMGLNYFENLALNLTANANEFMILTGVFACASLWLIAWNCIFFFISKYFITKKLNLI